MSLEDVITAAIAPASAAAAAAEVAEPVVEVAETPEPEAETVAEADPVEPVVEEGVTPPVEEVVPPVEVDEFAVEHGIKAKDTAGRENRIPYSAVKRINANAVKKATEALTTTYQSAMTEHTAKIADYEGRLGKIAEVENMMFDEPARFIDILKTLPGYEGLLAPAAAPAPAQSATPPPPDVDGGYSPEGLQKLLDWHTANATTKAVAEAEARIGKRYEPIEKRFKKEKADADYDAENAPKIQALLTDARANWAGYKENEAEIQKAYLGNPKMTLQDAWRTVVMPKFTNDKAKMRAEIIEEMKAAGIAAAKGTSVVPGAAPTTAARVAATATDPNAPIDLEATIRRSIAGLKK